MSRARYTGPATVRPQLAEAPLSPIPAYSRAGGWMAFLGTYVCTVKPYISRAKPIETPD